MMQGAETRCPVRPQSFTLVELLIVVAILGVLLSMLLPTLRQARESAWTVDCMSHLKMFGLAVATYSEDNRGGMPWAWDSPKDGDIYGETTDPWHGYGGTTWALLLYPYVNSNLRLYKCRLYAHPTHPHHPEYGIFNGKPYLVFPNYRPNPYLGCIGYGPGVMPPGWTTPGWFYYPAHRVPKYSDISNPTRFVFLFDAFRTWNPYCSTPAAGNAYFTNATGDGDRSNQYNYIQTWQRPNIGLWHRNRANFLFLDGHTELLPWTSGRAFMDLEDVHWRPDTW